MKKVLKNISIIAISSLLSLFSLGFTLPGDLSYAAAAETEVYLCGFAAGFEIKSYGATVLKTTEIVTESGVVSPSENAIAVGDVLLTVGGVDITCADDVNEGILKAKGGEVVVTILRNGEKLIRNVTPAKDLGGNYKLGLMLKDGTSGIGTMTFIKKDKTFMALGHPVASDDGSIMNVASGRIYRCSIFGVNKAERNAAGELKGMFIGDDPIGKVGGNLEQGIYGEMNSDYNTENLPLIGIGEATVGKATVVTCVDGVLPKEYSVSIVKADDRLESKNLVIKVTDEELLNVAGGIVQGMSGSPIVQNGKLVGAITHVFINDSTRGYGISVENMLNALSFAEQQAA